MRGASVVKQQARWECYGERMWGRGLPDANVLIVGDSGLWFAAKAEA